MYWNPDAFVPSRCPVVVVQGAPDRLRIIMTSKGFVPWLNYVIRWFYHAFYVTTFQMCIWPSPSTPMPHGLHMTLSTAIQKRPDNVYWSVLSSLLGLLTLMASASRFIDVCGLRWVICQTTIKRKWFSLRWGTSLIGTAFQEGQPAAQIN